MGTSEVGRALGLSEARVRQLRRDDPQFPKPVSRLSMGPVWLTEDIRAYAAATGRRFYDVGPCDDVKTD